MHGILQESQSAILLASSTSWQVLDLCVLEIDQEFSEQMVRLRERERERCLYFPYEARSTLLLQLVSQQCVIPKCEEVQSQ